MCKFLTGQCSVDLGRTDNFCYSRRLKVNNQRVFNRINCNVKARFDFVKMSEKNLECAKKAFEANIIDISVESIRLRPLLDVSEKVIGKVLKRKKKVRLNFWFNPDDQSVNTFTTIIRYDPVEKLFVLEYLDIPVNSFVTIRDTIDKLASEEGNVMD